MLVARRRMLHRRRRARPTLADSRAPSRARDRVPIIAPFAAAGALVTLLHFPIVMNMVSVLLCETAADVPGFNATLTPANSTVMTRLPDQECWDAYHLLYLVTPAMLTLAALYPVPSHYALTDGSTHAITLAVVSIHADQLLYLHS